MMKIKIVPNSLDEKKKTNEAASDYVYGVKNPGRVANIYKIKVVKK